MARVLLADRQPLFNDALETLLVRGGRHEVAGRCSSREAVLPAVRRCCPDLVLIDVELALVGEPPLLEQVLADQDTIKALVLSLKMNLQLVVTAVSAGAVGVVLKTSGASTVLSAVEAALGDDGLVPRATLPEAFRRLVDAEHRAAESPVNRLSLREREVLALLGRGWDNDSIGSVLYISPHTVRTHIQNILEKLELHSRLEAATLAMERASELPGAT